MYVDRYFKLIGGKVSDFLEINNNITSDDPTSQVTRISSGRQNQNGLAEICWKNLLN